MRKAGLTRQLLVGNGILLALIAIAFGLMLNAISDLRTSDRVGEDEQRLTAIAAIERDLGDVQAAHRGYAATGRPAFLAPRSRALRELPTLERRLSVLEETHGDPGHAGELRRLFAGLSAYVHGYSARIVAEARRDPAAARATIAEGEGARLMTRLRAGFRRYSSALIAEASAARASASDSADQAIALGVACLIGLVIVLIAVTTATARGVVRPLRRFAGAAHRISEGDLDVRVEEKGGGEVALLGGALNSMAAALQASREEIEAEHDRARRLGQFVVRLASTRQLRTTTGTLLQELRRISGSDSAALFLPDENDPDGGLRLVAAEGRWSHDLDTDGASPKRPLGRAVLEARPVVEDSALYLPVLQGGDAIGVAMLTREKAMDATAVAELEALMPSAAAALTTALALRDAQNAAQLQRAVLDSVQDAYIATDASGVIEEWSPQARAMYGYEPHEALGHRIDRLLLAPDERDEHGRRRAGLLDQVDGGPAVERFETCTLTSLGESLRTELSIAVVRLTPRSLVTYFARDVTEVRQLERGRSAERDVGRALAEADPMGDPIQPILGAIGENLDWAYGVFWRPDAADGAFRCAHSWNEPDDDTPEAEALLAALEEGEPRWLAGRVLLPVRSLDGDVGVIEFGTRSTEPPPGPVLDSLRSITDLIAQVVDRRRALEEADRLKSEFFALVSHELRTPLTSVMGFVELIRSEDDGPLNDAQRHYMEVLDRNTDRLLRLVGDLLFLTQVEAGTLTLEHRPVDLAAVVGQSLDAARPAADKAGIEVRADLDTVRLESGDGGRIGQLVDNLLSNALKFTPSGGTVDVRLREEGEAALIEVADTGMGIPQEDHPRLFERFYRSAAANRKAISGIGLGLSICAAIAESHDGSIAVESAEGEGTTFSVRLPRRPA